MLNLDSSQTLAAIAIFAACVVILAILRPTVVLAILKVVESALNRVLVATRAAAQFVKRKTD